ncbi:MAG: ABC transporter substrate-binding protein [Clostridia bacterium]|nr:ABC transporter substrate-binding protein [Clostridia bacterium]
MKRYTKVVFLLAALAIIFSLSGCGEAKPTIKVFNWGDYIDESVYEAFEKEYGIKVIYEDFTSNEDMYAKLVSGGVDYDVLFPSDYMIERLIKEDRLEKLNFDNIPNYKYIDERFKDLPYDPENEYSVPYFWGTLGILYNTKMVDEPVDSWDILWDQKYKKEIFMYASQRDSLGVALKKLGYSLNTRNEAELEEAKQLLIEQKPLVLAYMGDDIKDKMIGEEAALALVYSGDAVYATWENEDLAYAIPKEGTNLWFDAMVIPKGSKNKEGAEKFINWLCDPENALANAEYVGYSTPNKGAFDLLDDKLKNDKTAYPDGDIMEMGELFVDISDVIGLYNRIWDEVMTARD